jgi:hypothetical protein
MGQALQRADRRIDKPMAGRVINIGDEPKTTTVSLEFRAIQTWEFRIVHAGKSLPRHADIAAQQTVIYPCRSAKSQIW